MNPNTLEIEIFDSPDEAPNYNRDLLDVRAADIKKAVIVNKGMVSGKPTVDFQIQTQDGEKFVAMLSGSLVEQLASAVAGVKQRG